MLRITESPSEGSKRVIKLEGDLRQPWIPAVIEACRPGGADDGSVELDLAAVKFVDQAGIQVLKELLQAGISIGRCSTFVAEILQRGP